MRSAIVGNREIERSEPQLHQTAAIKHVALIWKKPQQLVAIGERLAQLTASHRTHPTTGVKSPRCGLDADRLVIVGDGAIVVTLALVGVAAIAVGQGEIGIEPDRLVEVGDGAVVVALPL